MASIGELKTARQAYADLYKKYLDHNGMCIRNDEHEIMYGVGDLHDVAQHYKACEILLDNAEGRVYLPSGYKDLGMTNRTMTYVIEAHEDFGNRTDQKGRHMVNLLCDYALAKLLFVNAVF